ncbi:MAG: hypothetical protein RIT25_930 [Planctomycetota bacterium]|jgi:hypothetical protein
MDPTVPERRFRIDDLAGELDAFLARVPDARWDATARCFRGRDPATALRLPLLAPEPVPGSSLAEHLAHGDLAPGPHVLLLLRAGASAVGWWDGLELVRHKAFKRYVVRGTGKAQPTHLKTRGKSRYGSRLRLQNWERQLGETSERLGEWWREFGAPSRVFVALPVRLRAEFAAAEPQPPFAFDDPEVVPVPFHVHQPDHAELLRVHALLGAGTVALREQAD